IDTGVFDQDRYFDVFVEYAKESPEDILIRISVHNRGPEAAQVHVLPTLWFRNQWSWHGGPDRPALRQAAPRPPPQPNQPAAAAPPQQPGEPAAQAAAGSRSVIEAASPQLGNRYLYCAGEAPLLFTENETNTQRIFNVPNRTPYVKDSINDFIVQGREGAVN